MLITSPQNPQIKNYAKLLLKKYRNKEKMYLIQGYYPLKFALENKFLIKTIYYTEVANHYNYEILDLATNLQIEAIEVSKGVIEKLSYIDNKEEIIAVAETRYKAISEYKPLERDLVLILESIEQVSDLGTLIRLADNTGATAIFICDQKTDIYHPGVIRSSLGATFTVPIYTGTTEETVTFLQKNNYSVNVTTPSAQESYDKMLFTSHNAIVMGNEYLGVSNSWLNGFNNILIPMYGKTNSLSVVSSAAIVLYEIIKNRN